MRKVNTGSLVAAIGAILLLVSLFLDWFQGDLTAWTTFEVWDLVLAGLAVATLVLAAAELGWWRAAVPRVRLVALAAVALLIVIATLLNHPPAAVGRDVRPGAWLALAATLVMAAGAALAEARISLSLKVDRREPAGAAHPQDPVAPATTAPAPARLLGDEAPTRVQPQ